MKFDRILDVARRKLRVGEEHRWVSIRAIGETGDALIKLAEPTGTFRSGPRKGRPKFDGAVELEVVVTDAETVAEETAYEVRTGLCSDCNGTCMVVSGVSVATGTKYDTCSRCKGDGKSHPSEDERTGA